MSTQFQLRRGTDAATTTFVGAIGEVTVRTTSNTLTLHDGVTPGGWPIVGANSTQTLYNKTFSTPTISGNLNVIGNIIPTVGNLYTLGNAQYPFKSLFVSGNTIYLGNATISTTSNSVVITTPAGGNFTITGDVNTGTTGQFSNLQVAANTAAISSTTGALTVVGGAGIGGNLYVGGNLNVAGTVTFTNQVVNTVTETVSGVEVVAGNLVANSGAQSTSMSTGALTVVGGAGISGNIYSGGNVSAAGSFYSGVGYFYSNGVPITTGFITNAFQGNLTVGNLTAGNIKTGVAIDGQMNTIYVAKNGNDSSATAGKFNSPFLTIKAALAAAPSGSTVMIAPGTYTENNPVTIPSNVSLMGNDLRTVFILPQNPNSDLFYVNGGCYVWGLTIKGYNANGFAYSSSTSSTNFYVSPYIQNITSSTTGSGATAVMVDGNFVGPLSTKGMILGFFTIINQNGRGVVLQNSAYSQMVNIYTIGAEQGVVALSGSFCTLNGSDSSIGNVALRADGYGPLLTYGNTSGYSPAFSTFNITMNSNVSPKVNQVMIINGDTNYYSIDNVTYSGTGNVWTVNIQETYTSNLAPNANIQFYQRSAIIASAHTFEYVGAGNFTSNALPQYGGIPNSNYAVIQTNGGHVTYTATDHKGNFMIGPNLTINQVTGQITGDSFNRSMFALMTPYILALEQY